MKATDLDILLQEGEGAMLEYKEGISSSLTRELVALANTAGGRICPEPLFVETSFVTATFFPNPEVRAQVETRTADATEHVDTTKLGSSLDQVRILNKCLHDSPIGELMALTGRTNRTKFRDQVLNPLIKAGFIEMTAPEKPRSSKQRYRITAAGRAVLEKNQKDSKT